MSRAQLVDRLTLWRRSEPRLVAGVAGGIADRLGVPDLYVRAAFVTLTTVWGLGAALYLVLWWLTLDHQAQPSRRELRTGQKVGLALAFAGGMWLLADSGFVSDRFTTFVIAAVAFGAAAVLDRPRQDRAAPGVRHLFAASEADHGGGQAGAHPGADSLHQ